MSQDPLLRFLRCYIRLSESSSLQEVLSSRKNLFCAIILIWAAYYKHDISSAPQAKQLYDALLERYSVVKAKACQHGACF
jgi:hypothetical protein